MSKLTFADVKNGEFTLYSVSKSGAISKHEHCSWRNVDYYFNHDDVGDGPAKESQSTLHINKKGNIHTGWSCGYFLNKDEAQALAIRIATIKYENSIRKIKTI